MTIIPTKDDGKSREWFFTFGHGQHPNQNYYVRIYGTFGSAREIMVRNFGRQWSGQYASAIEAGVPEFGLSEYRCAPLV